MICEASIIKLSICITTFNRAAMIGRTLDSILVQLTDDCEVLVVDGASTDGTEQLMSEYIRRYDRLRYVKQEKNNGFDQDCDRAVELARGEYCWLMTDDDLVKPGAVSLIFRAIQRDFSLVIVNAEARDFGMSRVLQTRWLNFESDRVYQSGELDRLFTEIAHILKYVGCVVIKRSIWLERERQQYFGSFFVYFGVIFQERLPGETLVIAEPCISYRMGNAHEFSPRIPEIQFSKWPSIVRSVGLPESAWRNVYSAAPWRHFLGLLWFRALGWYSLTEYRRYVRPQLGSLRDKLIPIFVALLPGVLVNASFVLYCSVARRPYLGFWQRGWMLQFLSESRYRPRNMRFLTRYS